MVTASKLSCLMYLPLRDRKNNKTTTAALVADTHTRQEKEEDLCELYSHCAYRPTGVGGRTNFVV